MKGVVLLGGGGHARACLDVILTQGIYRPIGILERQTRATGDVLGVPIIGSDEDLPKWVEGDCGFLVAVGQIKSPETRMRLFRMVDELGGELPVILSPKSHVSSKSKVGRGSIVMHFALVGPGATIGENCIINTRSLIEHDARIGNHCHVSTGAIINGRCIVGDRSFIGSGAMLKDGVQLGQRVVVGMGVVVRRNIGDGETVL